MLVFVTMQNSLRAEHCFRTGFKEYIRNVAIPEHEHVAEAAATLNQESVLAQGIIPHHVRLLIIIPTSYSSTATDVA